MRRRRTPRVPDVQKVYFIRRPDTKEVKIGVSRMPLHRLTILQCGSAARLEMAVMFDGTYRDEATWHRIFHEDRIGFEWFRESPRMTTIIEGIRAAIARGAMIDTPPGELA